MSVASVLEGEPVLIFLGFAIIVTNMNVFYLLDVYISKALSCAYRGGEHETSAFC